MIDLSIVSGTLNREINLARMVASVRETMPPSLTYEIVLVDGGSADGTILWARSQKDIRFIEQGRRLGAIAAYNAGFNEATGKYVVALNDDAIVHGQMFQQAYNQLERDPSIGQIAIPYTTPAGRIPLTQNVEFKSGK
jgi:glycosyltransferase involved in cell wall biosynthesis